MTGVPSIAMATNSDCLTDFILSSSVGAYLHSAECNRFADARVQGSEQKMRRAIPFFIYIGRMNFLNCRDGLKTKPPRTMSGAVLAKRVDETTGIYQPPNVEPSLRCTSLPL